MMMKSALDQTNTLSWIFYSASSLKQQSAGRHVAPLGQIILIPSEPTSLCSYSLMLCAQRRSNKYQFHSHWFDAIVARTHSRRARKPLHHRSGSQYKNCCIYILCYWPNLYVFRKKKKQVDKEYCNVSYMAYILNHIYIYLIKKLPLSNGGKYQRGTNVCV